MNYHSPSTGTTDHGSGAIRPRPARKRSAGIRDRLLAAADGLVTERQVSAITARDIARAADVADGALYNHFQDKHDLVLAALMARFEGLAATFDAEVAEVRGAEPPLPLEAGLDRLATAAFALHAAVLPMLAHVLSEPAFFHRFMVAIHQPPFGGRLFLDPFEEYVGAEQAAGRTGNVAPAAAADLLMGAVLMLAMLDLMAARPPAIREERLRAIVRTLMSGLAPRSSPG